MNDTVRSNRYHIGIFGRCNSGKSSLVNAIARQQISIVSDIAGTTTDIVWKNIELPGVGATVIGDTAGYDDTSELGKMRIASTLKVITRIDLALIVLSDMPQNAQMEIEWKMRFEKSNIPYIFLLNKTEQGSHNAAVEAWEKELQNKVSPISAKENIGINTLLSDIADIYKKEDSTDDITHSLAKKGDTVILVMPQDAQAPKGRLIQPQVVTLRNLLDKHCITLCCAPEELPSTLSLLSSPPSLIITDSQVFKQVQELTPPQTRLTSFSILMARHKGDIVEFVAGANRLLALPANARILIAESCSHIPQNEDIGRVKLPMLLRKKFGNDISIDIVSGNDFPDDLTQYDVIIHCGACMFTRRHVLSRIRQARAQDIPITNYGIAIAALTGILNKVEY